MLNAVDEFSQSNYISFSLKSFSCKKKNGIYLKKKVMLYDTNVLIYVENNLWAKAFALNQ